MNGTRTAQDASGTNQSQPVVVMMPSQQTSVEEPVNPFIGTVTYVATNVANAVLMILLFAVLFHSLNKLTPKVDFQEQLKDGNLAVALLLVGFAIAFALVLRA